MYISPTASDKVAACQYRALGAVPLGVICCQELPCAWPNQRCQASRNATGCATGQVFRPSPTELAHSQSRIHEYNEPSNVLCLPCQAKVFRYSLYIQTGFGTLSNAPEIEHFTWRPKDPWKITAWRSKSHRSFIGPQTRNHRVLSTSARGPQPTPSTEPPKMYMPSAVSDQPAVGYCRAPGGVPVGLICCQELPCRVELGYK